MVKNMDYNEFRKVLDFFSKNDTWLVCQKCCKGGDGNPNCEIRNCCKEREINICFDCSDFPCNRIKGNKKMIERAKIYKKLGKDIWLQEQIKKTKKGFELHTEKYYKAWVKKS